MKIKDAWFWFLLGIGLAGVLGVMELTLDAARASGIIKIALVDTGLDITDSRFKHLCKFGHRDFTETGLNDTHGHGSHITGILERNVIVNNYCYVILKYYNEKDPSWINANHGVEAFQYAVNIGVNIINYSSDGVGFDQKEYDIIRLHPNIQFNVAAGNDHDNLDEHKHYPCSYNLPNINCVGNRNSNSDYGRDVKHWENGNNVLSYFPNNLIGYMSGTSQATAIYTSGMINELQ